MFYTDIQDGHQKWRGNDLWEMSPVDSADTLEGQKFLRNCSILHPFRDKCIYVYYAEIQDGCQKWQENDFWKKSPVNSGDTLAIKKFNEIALSRIVSEINAFYAEIQDGHQKWRQNDFGEKSPVDSADTLPRGQKFQRNRCISHRFPDKCVFMF